ncbi:MAG: hypothetical protein ACOYNI_05460 [Acidimicrobiia bacterium]
MQSAHRHDESEATVPEDPSIPVISLDDDEFPFQKLSELAPRPVGASRPQQFFYAPIANIAPTGAPMAQRFPR